MNKIILVTGGIILVLILSALVSRPSSPAPVEPQAVKKETNPQSEAAIDQLTADWQEFKSDQFGYQIKYPKNWYLLSEPETKLPQQVSFGRDQAIFTVRVEESRYKNIDDHTHIEDLERNWYHKINLEVANTQARLLVLNEGSDTNKELATMFLLRDGYLYQLSWNATTVDLRRELEETFMRMIATFEFTPLPPREKIWI
jgi:hypothetical protein